MATSVEKTASSRPVIRMLQHSILQLCNEHVAYSNKLQILGVLCLTIDDEPHELVLKVNNTLKRVAPNTPVKEHATPPQTTTSATFQPPVLPMASPQPVPITITPIPPSQSVAQNLTKQFQQVQHSSTSYSKGNSVGNFSTALMQMSNVSGDNNTMAPKSQQPSTPVNSPHKDDGLTNEDNSSEGTSSTEKKSQGRKGRKPTKVHHVYDEGEFMSQEDEINEDNVLTVIPTDPDHPEDMEPIQATPEQQQKQQRSSSDSNHSIMRLALEEGAAAAMETARRKLSPYRNHPYVNISPTSLSSPTKPSGSASIRALLQAQAQMRQQMRLQHLFNSPLKSSAPHPAIAHNGSISSSPRSAGGSPLAGTSEVAGQVTGDAEEQPKRSSSEPPPNAVLENGVLDEDAEQEEALDFSSTADKHVRSSSSDGNLMVDDRPSALGNSKGEYRVCSPNGSAVVNVKEEPGVRVEPGPVTSQARLSENGDLSLAVAHASGSSLPSTPINYQSPFAGYAFVDRVTGLPTYQGMNLSLAAAGINLSNGTGSPENGGLSIQYTPTGPITVGPNGQNVSNSPRVKDIIMYDDQSPLKQQKGNKVAKSVQEGDFMLDKLGFDSKRRRRRSPDETLTAEEIAEYMGATNLGSANGPNSIVFKCKYCVEEMGDLVRYLQHTLTVHNAYICHQCGKSFTTKSSLLRHRPIHTGLRRFACGICKKTFYRKDKCKSHIKRHLGPGDQNNIDQYQQIEPVPELPVE